MVGMASYMRIQPTMYKALPYKKNTPKSSLFAQTNPHKYDNQV
jgi:hypothetical protein